MDELLAAHPSVSASEVAESAGVTRQAAHRHLARLVAQGRLIVAGRARATRYRATVSPDGPFRFPTAGLEEDRVLSELETRIPELTRLPAVARDVFGYAFLEILNNAIDHAGSPFVEIRVELAPGSIAFEIVDHGVGAWAHLRRAFSLANDLESIQEISKGKVTTAPDRHSGEGVFFVSKAGDVFEMESGELCWSVDNVRGDTAVLAVEPRHGTRVRFAARIASVRPMVDLFREYTDGYEFSRTRTHVRLFSLGLRFLSRSEARRMMRGLERFREVILDFTGVAGVGQAFADEVFRVWAATHPGIRLTPIEMNPPVAMMVDRARGERLP